MTEGVVRGWWEALYDVITMRQPLGTFERIVQLVVTARWIAFSFAPESGTGGVFHWTGEGGAENRPGTAPGLTSGKRLHRMALESPPASGKRQIQDKGTETALESPSASGERQIYQNGTVGVFHWRGRTALILPLIGTGTDQRNTTT